MTWKAILLNGLGADSMINLLRMELFKLGKNKVFWTLTIIVTVVFTLLHYLITIGWWKMDNVFMGAGLEMFSSLALATTPFYFMLFLSTLAGFFVTNEFTIGVVKNIVMSGNRRSHIFLAKFIVLALGSMFLAVVCPLIVIIGGKLLFGFGEMTDPSAVKRVFENLISNVIRHATGHVAISLKEAGGNIVLIIRNEADNLSEQDIDRLFDRFYTADRSRSSRRTGLGLSIAHSLMLKMNGQLSAELNDGYVEMRCEWKRK